MTPPSTKIVEQRYETVAVDQLKSHPENPRTGDVAMIADSIDRHGFYGAVIAQRSTGFVLAGNHRLEAAKQQGIDDLPVIWVDVDDHTARRILLVDNRSAEIATWDYEQLAGVLDHLRTDEDDLAGLGWAEHELEALLGADWSPRETDTDLEDFSNSSLEGKHTITLDDQQWAVVREALDLARDGIDVPDGQAVSSICAEWMDRR